MPRRATTAGAIVWAAWAGLALSGCGQAVPTGAEGRDVVRPALRFALDVPEGWTVRDLDGDVVLEIVAPPPKAAAQGDETAGPGPASGGGIAVVHVLAIDREGLPAADDADAAEALEVWADAAVEEASDLRRDLRVVAREETALADGRPALRIVLEDPRGIDVFEQRMLLAVTDRFAYGLLATGPRPALSAVEDALAACFGSLLVW